MKHDWRDLAKLDEHPDVIRFDEINPTELLVGDFVPGFGYLVDIATKRDGEMVFTYDDWGEHHIPSEQIDSIPFAGVRRKRDFVIQEVPYP
jgi:hypothetical protein